MRTKFPPFSSGVCSGADNLTRDLEYLKAQGTRSARKSLEVRCNWRAAAGKRLEDRNLLKQMAFGGVLECCNHDVSFIGTKKKGHALIYYLTNYATKVEDTMWKRVSILRQVYEENKTALAGSALPAESFLLKVANRLFTERSLSMVEVVSILLGQPTEYCSAKDWTYLNAGSLYKSVYATGRLRPSDVQNMEVQDDEDGEEADRHEEESPVYLTRLGKKLQWWQAYPFRGEAFRHVCLYDYLRLVKFVRVKRADSGMGQIPFTPDGPGYGTWVQVLRKPEYAAELSINGYVYTDFGAVSKDGIPM